LPVGFAFLALLFGELRAAPKDVECGTCDCDTLSTSPYIEVMNAPASHLDQAQMLMASTEPIDWEGVYEAELSRVYNYFRYQVRERAVAEDLTSLTFEKAWRSRHRYRRERASVSTWLLAIARNVARDHFRRGNRERPLEEIPEPFSGNTPESDCQRRSERRRLALLLSGLPERERGLIALKYGAQMTNREIARMTGLSESNVGTIVHRAIQALRERWDS
jgi:RNA polymerase sigma-70 factor (ECF subfamily)